MNTPRTLFSVLMVNICLPCVASHAAFVAIEFEGWVTNSELGHRPGARVTGYFTYQSGEPSGPQISSRPNFVFEVPEDHFRFERSSYTFAVYNNSLPGAITGDGIALLFPYHQGYGALSLVSSNTGLFANGLTPPTIPPLEQFDPAQTIYVTTDVVQPPRTTRIEIDRLSVVPGSGLGRPVLFGVEHTARKTSFRFLTEPSTRYAVQTIDNLMSKNWVTLTNIGPTMEPIAIIHHAASKSAQFYRVQKN